MKHDSDAGAPNRGQRRLESRIFRTAVAAHRYMEHIENIDIRGSYDYQTKVTTGTALSEAIYKWVADRSSEECTFQDLEEEFGGVAPEATLALIHARRLFAGKPLTLLDYDDWVEVVLWKAGETRSEAIIAHFGEPHADQIAGEERVVTYNLYFELPDEDYPLASGRRRMSPCGSLKTKARTGGAISSYCDPIGFGQSTARPDHPRLSGRRALLAPLDQSRA